MPQSCGDSRRVAARQSHDRNSALARWRSWGDDGVLDVHETCRPRLTDGAGEPFASDIVQRQHFRWKRFQALLAMDLPTHPLYGSMSCSTRGPRLAVEQLKHGG